MAGQSIGLAKSYVMDTAGGVGQYVCVVQSNADGHCKLPAAINATGFVGVTLEGQSASGRGVSVCKSGIVFVTANGNITRGDRLQIASAAGDVKSVEAAIDAGPGAAATFHIVGIAEVSAVAGDQFPMWIQPFTVSIAAS